MARARSGRRRRRSRTAAEREAALDDVRSLHLSTPRKRSPARGSSPGTLGDLSGSAPPRIELIAYSADSCERRVITNVEEIAKLVQDRSRVCWIDVESFGDGKALARIGEILGIHPLAMADVVNVPQRPKADRYDDRLLLVTQMVSLVEDAIDIEQVSIVFGPGWVVTFQEWPGDVFEPVRERLRTGTRVRQLGADFLTYALLDAVIDGYFPVVESIGATIEALEDEVLDHPTRRTLVRIHDVRRSLVSLHRILWRQRDAIGGLLRDTDCPFSEPVKVYLRDAYDHAFQIVDAIDNDRDMAAGLQELYLASASHRMGEVVKTLTLVSTIFIPLTFVVGVYGMNFDYMPELRWRYGYAVVWAGMIALGTGLYWWFRRRGYLEDQLDEDDPRS
jgi:magnesium transporter